MQWSRGGEEGERGGEARKKRRKRRGGEEVDEEEDERGGGGREEGGGRRGDNTCIHTSTYFTSVTIYVLLTSNVEWREGLGWYEGEEGGRGWVQSERKKAGLGSEPYRGTLHCP